MDKATKTALANDARKCREASSKLTMHADRIESLLEAENEIASLLFSDESALQLPLVAVSNGAHAHAPDQIVRYKRVIGTMTQPQACAAALEHAKIPLTTTEIASVIKDLELPVTIPKEVTQLGAVLSRHRDIFMTKGKGKWVLREESTA